MEADSSSRECARDTDPAASVEHLKVALRCANMGTWQWSAPEGPMIWDEQMMRLFGIADFDGNYRHFLDLIHGDDRERISERFAQAIRDGGECDVEFQAVRPSGGTVRVLRMRSQAAKGVEARPVRFAGVCWDVTERRLTEHQLATKSALLKTLMESLPDDIYFKNLDSRFIAVSEAKAARHDVDAEQMIGRSDFDYFSEKHAREAFEDEQRIIASGETIMGAEERETWPDGTETWVSTTKLPLRDDAGNIIGTFGLSRDITGNKRMEEELRAKNQALEEDLRMARELQSALLPQDNPHSPPAASTGRATVRFHHFFQPSTAVSGDFFDFLDMGEDGFGVFVCDVMGHGVRAALVAAIVRTLLKELRSEWADPASLLTQLNAALRNSLRDSDTPIFASAFCIVADPGASQLRYANAGHPWPLHHERAPASGPAQFLPLEDGSPGPALGLFDAARFELHHRPLSPRDVVLIFTDGLFEVESASGELFDYGRLASALQQLVDLPPAEICREVIRKVRDFSAETEFADDVCLVSMEIVQPRGS